MLSKRIRIQLESMQEATQSSLINWEEIQL